MKTSLKKCFGKLQTVFCSPRLALSLLSAFLIGCSEGAWRAGPNGADAHSSSSALPPSIHLEPGTKLRVIEQVSDRSWRYEIKEGKYAGNYVVILENDVEFK
jgi:hypothetical protein